MPGRVREIADVLRGSGDAGRMPASVGVVPIGFHWNGEELVFGTPPDAPKMKALRDGDRVAVTIDTDEMP
jgi:nitroimidazol reductase NimA-like FMN-containing flavoprotein (pyridoxamine 5'-phosphate oxidase superfamily)